MSIYISDSDLHLKLLAGLPIPVDGMGELTVPTVKEKIQIGLSNYDQHLSYLLFSKNSLREVDDEINKLSDFDLLLSLLSYQDSFRESFLNALKFFFSSEPQYESAQGITLVYFGELNEDSVLTEERFMFIKKVLMIANNIKDEEQEEYEPGNERAKKFMEKLKKNKERYAKVKKEKINLHSLISGVAWKTGRGMEETLNLTTYQLYDAYQRLENIDYYHYTLTGIYTGTIDGKQIKLPDINWANIIKQK